MSPEMEAFLLKRFRETYDAGRRGTPREQAIDLAVIVTGAQIDEELRRQVLQPQGQRP